MRKRGMLSLPTLTATLTKLTLGKARTALITHNHGQYLQKLALVEVTCDTLAYSALGSEFSMDFKH